MSYELICEGISPDEALEEQLLLQCRRLVVSLSARTAIQFTLRQTDGRIQARVEVFFANRRLAVSVWRVEPVEAMHAAVEAMIESVHRGDRAMCVAYGRRADVERDLRTELSLHSPSSLI
jgi:hypothetical protein